MKQHLLNQYEQRRNLFLAEKKEAKKNMENLYNQLQVMETEMKQCANSIKEEKENIRHHEEHPSFQASIEMTLSQSLIKQRQETLMTLGQLVPALQTKLETIVETRKQAEKGILLCEVCIQQLQMIEPTNTALLAELEDLLLHT